MPAKAGIPFVFFEYHVEPVLHAGGEMEHRYWVYIITDKPYGTLYTGVTNDLARRMGEHKSGVYKGFSKRYGLKMLVYYEEYSHIDEAIRREKCIKAWKREWKTERIKWFNSTWSDLGETLNS